MKKIILAATILALGLSSAQTASAGNCGNYNNCNWGAAVAGFFAGAVVTTAIQSAPAYCPPRVVYAPAPLPVVVYRQPVVVVSQPAVVASYYRDHGNHYGRVAYHGGW
jgi:hypothetical protein